MLINMRNCTEIGKILRPIFKGQTRFPFPFLTISFPSRALTVVVLSYPILSYHHPRTKSSSCATREKRGTLERFFSISVTGLRLLLLVGREARGDLETREGG